MPSNPFKDCNKENQQEVHSDKEAVDRNLADTGERDNSLGIRNGGNTGQVAEVTGSEDRQRL